MKLPHTEVKFYPEVKSQTGLSSLRVSCKRALRMEIVKKKNLAFAVIQYLMLKFTYRRCFAHAQLKL